ncbi:MAG: Mur ligase domain-containing protein [Candidatus Saccharimonadales bacterium]
MIIYELDDFRPRLYPRIMHIYFSGIGGAGISPLAEIAYTAGYEVSGSDQQETSYIEYLRGHGVTTIHIGQSREQITAVHDAQPIDWFVRSSAVPDDSEEMRFCHEQDIHTSKRDELLNQILSDKQLKLVAIAGTHGKSTTTAMTVWLFKQLGQPFSYLLPAKTSFAAMGDYVEGSEFFVYECDEFDRNFLAFEPHISLITGVSWDHHEIFPTREEYQEAFRDFIGQSTHTFLWQEDAGYLGLEPSAGLSIESVDTPAIRTIALKGQFNRLDAWLAIQAVHRATGTPVAELLGYMNGFPGLQRRMEQITLNLYSDYAHTPEKIRGAMSVALEMAAEASQDVVVIYEPLTNRRQHYMLHDYKDCFAGAAQVYWIPSYLAREDPNQRIIPPAELVSHLSDPSIAQPAERDENLRQIIQSHLEKGDMVVGIAGGGGGSLDDWLRENFQA